MEKKNPFVTTIGFRKDDSDHVYVAELLNSMGRGKAQYIVKAVLAYQDMEKKGGKDKPIGNTADYEGIKRIVLQVLEEREMQGKGEYTEEATEGDNTQLPKQGDRDDVFGGLDEDTMNGIMASIAAFQDQ
jgi:hypothetical protein